MSNEVSKPKLTMSMVLANKNIKDLGTTLGLTKEQEQIATSTALQLSSNASLCMCDKYSLAKFCYEIARYGMPDGYIYPVPYNKYVQVQFSYKFYREQCLRTGLYREIDAVMVLSCDKIVRDRETGKPKVIFEEDYEKTQNAVVIGCYAYATDKEGKLLSSVYWSKEKLEQHGRTYSKSYDSVWGKNFEKMAKKTVIKQLCGTLRITPEIASALKNDQIVFGGDGEENTYADNPQNIVSKEETPIVDVKDAPKIDDIKVDDNGEVERQQKVEQIVKDIDNATPSINDDEMPF